MTCKYCNSQGQIMVLMYSKFTAQNNLKKNEEGQAAVYEASTLADCPKCNGTGKAIE